MSWSGAKAIVRWPRGAGGDHRGGDKRSTRGAPMVIPPHSTGSSVQAAIETTTPAGPWTFKNRPIAVPRRGECRPCSQNTGAIDNGLPPHARHGQNERVIALGRRAWLFADSDRGAGRAAAMVAPFTWLADVLGRIASIPQNRLHELLPWEWKNNELGSAAGPSYLTGRIWSSENVRRRSKQALRYLSMSANPRRCGL